MFRSSRRGELSCLTARSSASGLYSGRSVIDNQRERYTNHDVATAGDNAWGGPQKASACDISGDILPEWKEIRFKPMVESHENGRRRVIGGSFSFLLDALH